MMLPNSLTRRSKISGHNLWNGFMHFPHNDKKNIEQLYNDTFNCFVLREYNGSHLSFPGLDKECTWALRISMIRKKIPPGESSKTGVL